MPAPLADIDQLSERLGISLDPESSEGRRGQAALNDASALIRSEGAAWADPATAPDIAVTICLAVSIRAFTNPRGATQASVGDVAVSFPGSGGAVYLTPPELRSIRKAAGASSVSSVGMTADLTGPDPRYVPVEGGGDPLPLGPFPWETET